MLTLTDLAALEAAVLACRPEAAGLFRPGLSPQRLEDVAAAAGVRLTDEARVWWTWHDGSAPATLPGVEHLSFAEAVGKRDFLGQLATQVSAGSALWHPAWLPLFETGVDTFVVDCSGAPEAPSPLRRVDFETGSQERIEYPSMGACIVEITEAVRERLTYDHELHRWTGR